MRLSTDRCLEIVRLGIQDFLVPEVTSDQGTYACKIILRTLDELLLRERALATGFFELFNGAIERCEALVDVAERRSLAGSTERDQVRQARVMLKAWQSAPNFAEMHGAVVGLAERLAVSLAEAPYDQDSATTIAGVIDVQNDLDQAILANVNPPAREQATDSGLGASEIEAMLGDATGAPVTISEFERIPGGLSKRTYRFIANTGGNARPLIARETAGPPHADFDCWILESEYALLHDLSDLGFAVPRTTAISPDKRYYVMERSPGRGRVDMFSGTDGVEKSALLDMARFMARLHTVPPAKLVRFVVASGNQAVLDETVDQCVRRMLLTWKGYSERMRRMPSPAEDAAFAWLWAHVPQNDAPPSILHGDYGPHNCLWEKGRLTAVLDWEGGHFGDPAFDLGYARAEFESLMDWGEFLDAYHAEGGPRMTPERLEYFERFAMYRTLITDNQCVARGEYGDKSDLFILQVDHEYWPAFLANTAASFSTITGEKGA